MNDNNEIIKFEDLFKEEIKQRKSRQNPEHKKNYGYALIVYILIMYVLATVLFLVAAEIPALKVTYTETELVLENVASDLGGIGFLDAEAFDTYKENYLDQVISIGIYEDFHVIVNAKNNYYDGLLVIINPETEEKEIRVTILEDMISISPTIDQWYSGVPVTIYEGRTQMIPDLLLGETVLLEGPLTVTKDSTLALLNFLIYIALLPGILYLLKYDIQYDIKESKEIKGQFFLAIIIGYLYIILGNIFAGYLSEIMSNLFKLAPSESINQEVIVSALRSEGMILMILSAVILGPIVEELIFRKAVFGLIKSNGMALFVSTFVFGIIHLVGEASVQEALVNGISYFVMGFIFGYIYIKNNRNIMIPIAVHILSNLVSVLFILLFL
ncbi:MAG: CPBP family intramembrane metalloprotease [Firmicutes bacterium]|nr:CPBP family intramembrane metalloprotease [Bacillota bacterium]